MLSFSVYSIITKGDNNNVKDDPIDVGQIRGVVVLIVPFVGIIIGILKEPFVILAFLALAIWLLERSFKKEKSEEQNELDEIKKEIEALE